MNTISIKIVSLFGLILILFSPLEGQGVEDNQTGALPATLMLLDEEVPPISCNPPSIVAELLRCSGDGPMEVAISANRGPPIRIDAVPTLSATPTPNDWGLDSNSPPPPAVPAVIDTNSGPYILIYAGSVQNQVTCFPPMTDAPIADPPPVPLTTMVVEVTYTCMSTGEQTMLSFDVLPTLTPP